jgi:hypothetical protein
VNSTASNLIKEVRKVVMRSKAVIIVLAVVCDLAAQDRGV